MAIFIEKTKTTRFNLCEDMCIKLQGQMDMSKDLKRDIVRYLVLYCIVTQRWTENA